MQIYEKNTTDGWASIRFNLDFDNAWRINTGASNWCAAWIFAKYRLSDGIWRHATLSNLSAHHNMPENVTGNPASDGKGIFIFDSRENAGEFDFSASGIIIRWNYSIDGVSDAEESIEIKLFGIEMVYIPENSFYLGSGGTEPYAFYQYPTTSTPFQVTSESSIAVGQSNGNLYYDVDTDYSGDGLGPVGDLFPKGFKGFYVMRYEISQQQYVDFLNTLTRNQQQTRTNSNVSGDIINQYFVMSGTVSMVSRNGISCNMNGNGTTQPINFYCDFNENRIGNEAGDGQTIACNFLSWADGMAYFDWAGLRPMTEFEFEKACRGPNTPVPNEYAWGNNIVTQVSTVILNSGFPAEIVSNADIGLSNYNQPVDFGPLRCGFAATAITNRQGSASSYYGVLNMSDNLSERCISIGTIAGRAFTGLHGDGNLTATGNANVINWPGLAGQSARGGNYLRESFRMAVSNRSFASYSNRDRTENLGWRGARTFE